MPNINIVCSLVVKDGTHEYQANEKQKQTKDQKEIVLCWLEH